MFEDWVMRLHPDDKAAVLEALQRYLADEISVYESDHRVRCNHGAYKWMRSRARVMERAADGSVLRMVGIYSDIDAGKAVEGALHESEQRLRHLAARIPGMVFEFLLRPDGTMGMPYSRDRKSVV